MVNLKSITFTAVSIFAFVFCANSSEISKNVNLLSEIEPYCSYFDIVVSDTVAYCTNEYGLVLINVSNPEDPQLIRRISTPGIANGLALRDTLLYLCDGYEGLKVFSISDLLNPVEIGKCSTEHFTYMIDIENDIACITHKDDKLFAINIENPENPEILGRCEFGVNNTTFIDIIEEYVFYVDRRNDVLIVDLSDPFNLPGVSRINGLGSIEDEFSIKKQGDFLFILTDSHFITVDFHDPENPEILYERDIGTICNKMFLVGDELYIPAIGGGIYLYLYVYDISDPVNPERVRAVGPRIRLEKGNFTFVSNDIWYITRKGSGLMLFDIGNLDEFSLLGEFSDPDVCYNFLTGANNLLYPIDTRGYRQPEGGGRVLKTISIEDPENPEIISYYGECFEQTTYHIKSISDDYLYFYDGSHNTTILNVENPELPELSGYIRGIGSRVYELSGNWLFTVGEDFDGETAFFVYWVANPAEPEFWRRYYLPEGNYPTDIAASETHVYVLGSDCWLHIYNRTRPYELELISTYFCESSNIAYWQDHVYMRSDELVIVVDVSDPENPQEVYRFEQPFGMLGNWQDLIAENGILFHSNGVRGVFLFNLDDPAHPDPVGFYNTPGIAQDLEVIGNNFYVADKWGIGCYDYSECLSLWYLETSVDSLAYDSVAAGNRSTLELILSSLSEIPREITDIRLDHFAFECNTEVPFMIEPLSDTTLSVVFMPRTTSQYNAQMTIQADEYEITIPLSGTGYFPNGAEEEELITPLEYSLSECYPNPFNSTTRLTYGSPENADISLCVFDMNGRLIKELVNGTVVAGNHVVNWDAEDVSAGIYLVQMKASTGFKSVVKVMLIN